MFVVVVLDLYFLLCIFFGILGIHPLGCLVVSPLLFGSCVLSSCLFDYILEDLICSHWFQTVVFSCLLLILGICSLLFLLTLVYIFFLFLSVFFLFVILLLPPLPLFVIFIPLFVLLHLWSFPYLVVLIMFWYILLLFLLILCL